MSSVIAPRHTPHMSSVLNHSKSAADLMASRFLSMDSVTSEMGYSEVQWDAVRCSEVL